MAEGLASERDFYRRLLDLGGQEEVEPLLEEALGLIVEVTGAAVAYLELYDETRERPRFWKGHGISEPDVADLRRKISHGIIARALADGRTIETASAFLDERFSNLTSVRQHAIEAVLCAPVGTHPPIGVIYLQGRAGAGRFTAIDRERAEMFARQLGAVADRILSHRAPARGDHTTAIRERIRCPEIVGRTQALAHLLHAAAGVAPLDVDVLITGPSGTGKSLLAKVIANNSKRATGPFIELNCAALPEPLLESELFGAERGAHSTATSAREGKVAAAEGGTLFLDEIGELPASAQAKLLQLLETREYHPLGSRTVRKANVRVLSATNADLDARIAAKQFREDLYYRLHVVPLEVPGLDERRDDIPDLVEHFCAEACAKHGMSPISVTWRALVACRNATWPGHTRQLAHAIEAAVIRAHSEGAPRLEEKHIFPKASDTEVPRTLQSATREFQKGLVRAALEKHDWNVTEAARELGLARSHVYNLINDFELREGREGRAADKSKDRS